MVAIFARDKLAMKMEDKNWEMMDDIVLSTIQLCLSDSTLQGIHSESTTICAWKKLEEIYLQKSITNRLCLKMAEGTYVKTHISDYTFFLMTWRRLALRRMKRTKPWCYRACCPRYTRSLRRPCFIVGSHLPLMMWRAIQ